MHCSFYSVTAQVYKRVKIETGEKPIDLVSLDNNQCHLVTDKAIYTTYNLVLEPFAHFKDQTLLKAFQNYCGHDVKPCYPLERGGYACFEKNKLVHTLQIGDLDSGPLFTTRNGIQWLINNSLFRNRGEKWFNFKELNIYTKFRDVKVYSDKVFLANYGGGLIVLDELMEKTVYSKKNGLASNYCTSIAMINQLEFFVGHRGAISHFIGDKIKVISVAEELGELPVLELEVDRRDKLWGITSNKVFSYEDDEITVLPVELNPGEKFIALQICDNQDIWVVSDEALYVFPKTSFTSKSITNSGHSDRAVQLYKVRGKHYYTDTENVYAYNSLSGGWEVDAKKDAPQTVLTTGKDQIGLIFNNNKGIWLHNKSAQKLGSIRIPDDERINSIEIINGEKYYATETNLYKVKAGIFKLLSHKEDNFYKLVKNYRGVFAFGANGIYKVYEDRIEPLLASYHNHEFPFCKNQFVVEDKLVTITDKAVHVLDSKTESIDVVNLSPLEVLDIKEDGPLVWLLTTKSAIAINKTKLLDGTMDVVRLMPIYKELKDGQLFILDKDELWVAGVDELIKIDKREQSNVPRPFLDLHKIVNAQGKNLGDGKNNHISISQSDLPVALHYHTSNYWTDEINYAYHVNHDGENLSEWKSSNSYSLTSREPGRYVINAKFKDDIYGLNIEAPTIIVDVSELDMKKANLSKLYIFPFLAFCMVLLILFKLIRPQSHS